MSLEWQLTGNRCSERSVVGAPLCYCFCIRLLLQVTAVVVFCLGLAPAYIIFVIVAGGIDNYGYYIDSTVHILQSKIIFKKWIVSQKIQMCTK